jgi:hypothetical protein
VTHLRRESEVRLGVAQADIGLAAVVCQSVEGERLDRPQHAEPRPAGRRRRWDDEAMVREFQQGVEKFTADGRRADHGTDLLQIKAAVEYAELMKQILAVGWEEVVTPRDNAFERPLPGRSISRSAARQRQARSQAVTDDRWRQG